MNVKELVAKALKDGGYDGLCDGDTCGCSFAADAEFMHCARGDIVYCECAYSMTHAQAEAAGLTDLGDCDFVMVPASEWEKCEECDGVGITCYVIGSFALCRTCKGVGFVRIKKLSAGDARCEEDRAKYAADKQAGVR